MGSNNLFKPTCIYLPQNQTIQPDTNNIHRYRKIKCEKNHKYYGPYQVQGKLKGRKIRSVIM